MGEIIGYSLLSGIILFLCNKIYAIPKRIKNIFYQIDFEKKLKQETTGKIAEYCKINNYSLCLSIDYKRKGKYKIEGRDVLNKIIYLKIQKTLRKLFPQIETKIMGDVLIILSSDFNVYDEIYDTILKMLSKIKFEITDRYYRDLIPSITTDAYKSKPNLYKIKQNHNNIKHCNFINQACSTKAFSKKYILLNKDKYSGTPLGEYSIVSLEQENTYDLNMVDKDLSLALEKMG